MIPMYHLCILYAVLHVCALVLPVSIDSVSCSHLIFSSLLLHFIRYLLCIAGTLISLFIKTQEKCKLKTFYREACHK